jgi:hypothetical protein
MCVCLTCDLEILQIFLHTLLHIFPDNLGAGDDVIHHVQGARERDFDDVLPRKLLRK